MKAAGGQEVFFAIDSQQQVVMWAAAAEALLGFEAEEALGRPCWQVLKGSDVFGRPLYCERCQACLRSGATAPPPAHHLFIKHRDGRLLRLVHELVPLPPGPGPRALVLLGEASSRMGPASDGRPASDGAALALGSFGGLVKGLAALGLIADSLPSSGFFQTLDSTLDRVLGLTGAEAAEVFLWDPLGREMCLSAHRGLFRSAFRQITHFQKGQGFPGLVAATGEPLVTYELAQDPRYLRTKVKEKGVRFYMCVPLLAPRGVVGCLNIASRRLEEGQASSCQFLSWLAAPLASAVELTSLRSQEMVEWMGEGALPPAAVPRHLLKAMVEASEADQGFIALWGPMAGAPMLVEAHPKPLSPCLREGNGHLCPACKTSQPLVVRSGAGSLAWAPCRGSLGEAREAICIPLGAGGGLLGVVSLRFLQPQPVPTRPLALLGAMAPRAGRVLRDAWPYLQKEDPLALDGYPSQGIRERQPYVLQQPPAQGKREMVAREPGAAPFLDIRCFGSFQVLGDGEPLAPASFGRRQSFIVLKILVTRRGRPVSRDFLAEALWPEAPPEAASKRLWVVVHSLRAGLEPGLKAGQLSHFVLRDGDSYSFNPKVSYRLDVEDFLEGLSRGERLEAEGDLRGAAGAYQAAAQLYRGDFLEEEAYSDWCSAEREYLREVYLSLLKRLASLYAVWEDWDRSIAWHRRALLVDNLREEVHRETMRCLRRAGRRDEALRQYLDCRQVLDRELGVEPLPETEQLYREILEEEKRQ